MDLIKYTRDYDNELGNDRVDTREATEISFEVANDLNIYEFKIICMRMAAALGYADSSIREAFGDEDDINNENIRSSLISKMRGKDD